MDEQIKTRIELLFFDPEKSHDEYLDFFYKVRPSEQDAIYSPLYNLRNEIFELSRKGYWLSAILLSHIVIDGIASYFFEDKNDGQDQFYKEYVGLSDEERIMHRIYRNAREHNFGQLLIHLDHKKSKFWHERVYSNFILANTKIEKDPNAIIKVVFELSIGFPKIAEKSRIRYNPEKKPYYFFKFNLNPRLFINAVNKGCDKLRDEIQQNEKMKKRIMEDLTEDNWVRITYPGTVTQLPEKV